MAGLFLRACLALGAEGEGYGVRGPFGTAWPIREAEGKDLVIVGGGLGLAPLRPAIYYALAQRPEYGNIELIYGARTPQDTYILRSRRSPGMTIFSNFFKVLLKKPPLSLRQ